VKVKTGRTIFGSFPVVNLVILELGLALGLLLIAINESLLYVGAGVLAVALIFSILRLHGTWFTHWSTSVAHFKLRSHNRITAPVPPVDLESIAEDDRQTVSGPEDARVNLLRLVIPDLLVAHGTDHTHQPVGLAWHDGAWTAVLLVEPTPAMITAAGGAPNLPLSALAPCLEDRGVILDTIQVIWHCYPGSAALPANSPALSSYMEILGPLPAVARRTTWVAVRLDPRRCPAAVHERGGGVIGAHRALIGALSRVRNALESRGIPTRPLDPNELLRSGISAAELASVAGSESRVSLQESWTRVTAAGIGHSSYAISKWPTEKVPSSLNALTSVRTLSATVALSISTTDENKKVGLRGLVRLSARNPQELKIADERLAAISDRLGIELAELHGRQVDGLSATLPLGGQA
jgi:type VII secretion protein EccE